MMVSVDIFLVDSPFFSRLLAACLIKTSHQLLMCSRYVSESYLSFQDLTSSDDGGKCAYTMPTSGENERVTYFRRKRHGSF